MCREACMQVDKELTMSGTKNKIVGKIREVKGRITGDEKEEIAGKVQQVAGEIQAKVGRASARIVSEIDAVVENARKEKK